MDRFLTQCPQCATLFKVSANQLQLGEGQVRCGSCMHVFNGADAIIQSSNDKAVDNSEPAELAQENDLSGIDASGSDIESSQQALTANSNTSNDKNADLAALDKELDAIFDDSYLDDFGLDDADLDSDELLESQLSEAEAQLLNTPLDQLNDFAVEASEILEIEDFDFEDDLDDFDLDASLDFDNLLSEPLTNPEQPDHSIHNESKDDVELALNIEVPAAEEAPDLGAIEQPTAPDNVLNFDTLKQKRLAEKEQADSKLSKELLEQAEKEIDAKQTQSSFNIDHFMMPDVPGKDSVIEETPPNKIEAAEQFNDEDQFTKQVPSTEEVDTSQETLHSDLPVSELEASEYLEAELEEFDPEAYDLEVDDLELDDLEVDDLDESTRDTSNTDSQVLDLLIDEEQALEAIDLDFENSDSLEDFELDSALNENITSIASEQTLASDAEAENTNVEQKIIEAADVLDSELIDLDLDDASHPDSKAPTLDVEEVDAQELSPREVDDQEAEIIADFIAAQSELDLEQNVVDALDNINEADEFTIADSAEDLLDTDLLSDELLVDDSEVETQTLFDQYNDQIESISITSEERILADLNPQQIIEPIDETSIDNVNELTDVEEGRLPWQQQANNADATLEAVLKKNDISYDALAIADIQINLDQVDNDEDDVDTILEHDEPSFEGTFDINEQLIEVEDYSNLKRFLWFMGSIILVFTLLLQYIWFNRAELQYEPLWQPVVEEICQSLPCQLAPKRDVSKIKISHRLVKPIGDSKKQMSVDLMLVNNANFEQPYPTIMVDFSDHNGAILSQEKILPAQYLSAKRQMSLMPKAVDIHVHFEMNKPANLATGYTFKFE